jgi:protein-L-isoaspartate(D-aspartate) O-methyltransferase
MNRRFFAEEVAAVAGIDSERLIDAFARVPREEFLGPGPWEIVQLGEGVPVYRRTPDADPKRVNHNVVVAIDSSRNLNNGHPSALATWIDRLQIGPRDSVLHIGTGTGYYTAILAELAEKVVGIEIDPQLASRARSNLTRWSNVALYEGDGSDTHGAFDAVFVNAGATHPRREWLDALKPGGRLLVPITVPVPQSPLAAPNTNPGMMLLIRDREARFTGPVQIYDCAGARDASLEPALRKALFGGGWRQVRRLRCDPHQAGPACVIHGAAWCLAIE